MDKKDKYWQLFLSTFKLSACTFGGGFVIIPLMRERFVKELHWIEEEETLDLTAIAQSSPGSIAINASILMGYHVAGIPGALITVVGAALPPLIIISIISAFYQAFRSNKYVSMAMAGMLAGVAAVIFDVVINMAWPILKKKRWLPIAVMLAAFAATRFFSVNIILIILVCGVIGALDTMYLQKREDSKGQASSELLEAESQRSAEAIRGQNQGEKKSRNRSQESRHSCGGHCKGRVRPCQQFTAKRADERSTNSMNITYTQNGDYLIPNIIIRKTKPLGHYGRLRKAYLEMHRPILFNELVLSDKLFEHCAEIDEAARNRMELIVRSLAEQNGVTEQLKAKNQMEWVRQMNACKAQADEIVKAELIYD